MIGVNEVTKSLELDEIGTVLLTGDVNPQMMVKHVVDLAVLRNVPLLVVPELRTVLKQSIGFGSLAIGFKKNLTMDSKYWAIDQKVKELAANYPVPVNHINVARQQVAPEVNKMETESRSDETSESRLASPPQVYYLYRTSIKYRCFVPESTQKTDEVVHKMQVDSSGFVPFAASVLEKEAPEEVSHTRPRKISYKSLLIKKVRNNEDRSKKKIEMLKRKNK